MATAKSIAPTPFASIMAFKQEKQAQYDAENPEAAQARKEKEARTKTKLDYFKLGAPVFSSTPATSGAIAPNDPERSVGSGTGRAQEAMEARKAMVDTSEAPAKKDKTLLYIGIGVGVVILIVLAFRGRRK